MLRGSVRPRLEQSRASSMFPCRSLVASRCCSRYRSSSHSPGPAPSRRTLPKACATSSSTSPTRAAGVGPPLRLQWTSRTSMGSPVLSIAMKSASSPARWSWITIGMFADNMFATVSPTLIKSPPASPNSTRMSVPSHVIGFRIPASTRRITGGGGLTRFPVTREPSAKKIVAGIVDPEFRQAEGRPARCSDHELTESWPGISTVPSGLKRISPRGSSRTDIDITT